MLAEKVDYRPFRFPEENLEALADADNSIDHLITADVFEHVRLDELAFREVYRVLKAGGYFFLQVPTVTTCCRGWQGWVSRSATCVKGCVGGAFRGWT